MSDKANSGEKDKGADVAINGELRQVTDRTVTYEQIVELAFPSLTADPNSTFTVLYRKTDNNRSEGSLVPGASVKVHRQGSSFSVTHSIRS